MLTVRSLVLMAVIAGAEPAGPGKADVRGVVISVKMIKTAGKAASDTLLLIDGKKEADTKFGRAAVRVPDGARVYAWRAGKKAEAKLEDIKRGTKVQLTFSGPVNDSVATVIGPADEVLILEAPEE